MAYTSLTTTVLPKNFSLTNLTTAASATVTAGSGNGVAITNDGQTFLVVNATGTGTVLTIKVGGTIVGQSVVNPTATIGAVTGTFLIGPWDSGTNQPGSNTVDIDFSVATGVTVGAFKLTGAY